MNQVFVAKGFGQRGPYSEKEVHELLLAGEFSWDDLAWREGMEEWKELRFILSDAPAEIESANIPVKPFFHHVAPWKFLLLSIVTLGFYQFYWFYKSWVFVKEEEETSLMPFWRTVFTPIWFYPLAIRIFRLEGAPRRIVAGVLAIAYFLIGAAWQFPGLISYISLGNFLLFVPLLISVDRLNLRNGIVGPAYRRLGWVHGMAALVGMPILVMLAVTTFQYMTAKRLVGGAELLESEEQFLRENEILPSGESVIIFYATDLLDRRLGGHFFTEKRVVSYRQEMGEIWMHEVLWRGIEAIFPLPSLSDYGPAVRLLRSDGSDLMLYLADEEEKNKEFVDALTDYWRAKKEIVAEKF